MHSRGYQSDSPQREVVITGLGVISPIGIGADDYWESLVQQRSGITELTVFDNSSCPCKLAGQVDQFEPKQYVRPRKSLKVMSRDIQLGVAAADMAVIDSGLSDAEVDPERMGVIYGADMIYCDVEEMRDPFETCIVDGKYDYDRWGSHALSEMYPLWLLKYLPNMPACHVGIAHDAARPEQLGHFGRCIQSAGDVRGGSRDSAKPGRCDNYGWHKFPAASDVHRFPFAQHIVA